MHCLQSGSHTLGDFEALADGESVALLVGQEAVESSVLGPLGDLEELMVLVDVIELENGQKIRMATDASDSFRRPAHYGLPLLDVLVAARGIDLPGAHAVPGRVALDVRATSQV